MVVPGDELVVKDLIDDALLTDHSKWVISFFPQ